MPGTLLTTQEKGRKTADPRYVLASTENYLLPGMWHAIRLGRTPN